MYKFEIQYSLLVISMKYLKMTVNWAIPCKFPEVRKSLIYTHRKDKLNILEIYKYHIVALFSSEISNILQCHL